MADEAFSILAAQQSLVFIVTRLGFEPPVYYAMLHFWIKLFGSGEIAARSLSLVGFLLSTALMIEWSHALYKKHWLSWYLPLFFFLNPMLLYYAFEVRTYGWYIFFATTTLMFYSAKQWKWFIVSALLGFYTHVYMLPFIGILGFIGSGPINMQFVSFPLYKKTEVSNHFLSQGPHASLADTDRF